MTPFQTPFELMWSDRLQGATDLYQVLLTLKHGFGNGESTLGCYSITKADAKRAGIKEIILSADNEKDILEIKTDYTKDLKFRRFARFRATAKFQHPY